MLDRPICSHSEVFYPNDLDDLKAVFDALCFEFHVLHSLGLELTRQSPGGSAFHGIFELD